MNENYRQTGRTMRMVKAAAEASRRGEHVIVVVSHDHSVRGVDATLQVEGAAMARVKVVTQRQAENGGTRGMRGMAFVDHAVEEEVLRRWRHENLFGLRGPTEHITQVEAPKAGGGT